MILLTAKGRFFNLDIEIDGSKNLQITPLRFYLIKSCLIRLKILEINDKHVIMNF